ncbi:hypothetical protein PO415_25850, partial [Escherichia coli]
MNGHNDVLKKNARQPLSVHAGVTGAGHWGKDGEKKPGHKGRESRQMKTAIFMSTLRHQIPGAGAGRSSTPAEA